MELFIKLVACKDSQNKINLLLSKESVTNKTKRYHISFMIPFLKISIYKYN